MIQALCEKIALVHLDLALGAALGLDVQLYPGKAYVAGVTLASSADVDPRWGGRRVF